MKHDRFRILLGIATVLVLGSWAVTFTVRERHTVLVTRFGELVRTQSTPGLFWKLPWPLEATTVVDERTRVFATRHSEMLTRDKKNVILVSFVAWRVADAAHFVRAVGDVQGAEEKLDGLVTDAKIGVLGRFDLAALVSTTPETLRAEEIEAQVLEAAAAPARERYGIELLDVGFQRLSLPADNIEAVFDQMRAERRKFADAYRAAGERDAATVRAEADLEVARTLADAEEQAARIRGEAEAEAARIYSDAYSADPELFTFVRRLESLEELVDEDTTLILQTDRSPFDLLIEGGAETDQEDEQP